MCSRAPFLLLAPLAACDGGKDDSGGEADPTPAGATWVEAFDTSATGALSGVWGTGPDDVWIVGGTSEQGEIYHYDGTSWSPVPVPAGVGLLVWAYGFGPDDVYAVGVRGAVVHWDGTAWTQMDAGTTRDLWGVWGAAPDDLWIVGGEVSGTWPITLHWDGSAFTEVTLSTEQNLHGGVALFKVWGIDGRIWAVGDLGLIVEWDGTQWVEQFGGQWANDDFVSLWGTSADHVVAVGGRNNGRIAHFDGTSWTTEMPGGMVGLNAVYMGAPDEAVIGGIYGYTATLDPVTGDYVDDTIVTQYDIHAIWGDGAGTYYGVGGTFTEPYYGVAIKREPTP